MTDSTELKGRAKQAAGDLTNDKDLKREGSVDRAAGSAKDHVGDTAGKAKEKLDGAADKVKELIHKD